MERKRRVLEDPECTRQRKKKALGKSAVPDIIAPIFDQFAASGLVDGCVGAAAVSALILSAALA